MASSVSMRGEPVNRRNGATRGTISESDTRRVNNQMRKIDRESINAESMRDTFAQYSAGKITQELAMLQVQLKSKKRFYKLYNHYYNGLPSTPVKKGRPATLTDTQYKACKEHFQKRTLASSVGMNFNVFKHDMEQFLRASYKEHQDQAGEVDNSAGISLELICTESRMRKYFKEFLSRKVNKGDKALQDRINVKNDLLAYIGHFIMFVIASMGLSDKLLYPYSGDLKAALYSLTLNIDTFSCKLEGGSFEKKTGNTTKEAMARHVLHDTGMGICTDEDIAAGTGYTMKEVKAMRKDWAQGLAQRQKNGNEEGVVYVEDAMSYSDDCTQPDDNEHDEVAVELDEDPNEIAIVTQPSSKRKSRTSFTSSQVLPSKNLRSGPTNSNKEVSTPTPQHLQFQSKGNKHALIQPPNREMKSRTLKCRGVKEEVLSNAAGDRLAVLTTVETYETRKDEPL